MASAQKKKSASAKKSPQHKRAASAAPRPIRREVWAIVCFFIGLFSFIGYFSVDAVFVNSFCKLIKMVIGYGYYVFPIALFAVSAILLFHRGRPVTARAVCMLLIPLFFGAFVHLFSKCGISFSDENFFKLLRDSGALMKSGGVLSGVLAMGLVALVSIFGAVPVLLFAMVALLMVSLKISPAKLAAKLKARDRLEYDPADYPEEPLLARQDKATAAAAGKRIAQQEQQRARRAIDIPMDEEAAAEYTEKRVGFFNTAARVKTPDQVYRKKSESAAAEETGAAGEKTAEGGVNLMSGGRFARKPASNPTAEVKPLSVEEAADIAGVKISSPEDMVRSDELSASEVRELRSNAKKTIDAVELKSETDEVEKAVEEKNAAVVHSYNYPPAELLHRGAAAAADGKEEIAINSERLQATLDSFGVSAAISDITRGPTVTRYDVELETGVKLSKLTNLAGDLALSLGVSGVRIAPIPDKISTVGIEVPNKIVSTVYLREIISSDAFTGGASKLTFALGKDIGGNAIVGNIAKLPHLLIAGTTGSGKSVCMNCLILSLLYKATPEEVRLIMIDPKMVELGIYNGIPHLYIPVVTDPKKAAGALQWSVIEMLKRYRLFSECGVRDLAGYNALQKKNNEPILPQVVIVIDELADLMMTAAKEVEESICRVAQMGRAAGVHLVIATQRPSADVITGLMKANIPSRIAFAVSSAMESRIILDQMGAEKLVGSGDMLYAPLGIGKPTRIQGAFVTDDEREEVVNFVKQYGEANYDEEVQAAIEKAAEEKSGAGSAHAESVDEPATNDFDELLPQAVDVILETKQASVSMLQRRLKLGYSRAARIVDQMEEIGVVGPFEGSKPRQILVTREQWLEMQTVQGTAPIENPDAQMGFADLAAQDDSEQWSGE